MIMNSFVKRSYTNVKEFIPHFYWISILSMGKSWVRGKESRGEERRTRTGDRRNKQNVRRAWRQNRGDGRRERRTKEMKEKERKGKDETREERIEKEIQGEKEEKGRK